MILPSSLPGANRLLAVVLALAAVAVLGPCVVHVACGQGAADPALRSGLPPTNPMALAILVLAAADLFAVAKLLGTALGRLRPGGQNAGELPVRAA